MNRSLRALAGVSLTAALVTSPLVATDALATTGADAAGAGKNAAAAIDSPPAPTGLSALVLDDTPTPTTPISTVWNRAAFPTVVRLTVEDPTDSRVLLEKDVTAAGAQDDETLANAVLNVPISWSYGDEFRVSARTVSPDGQAVSDPITATAYAPLSAPAVVTSVSAIDYHSPSVVVTWSHDGDESTLQKWTVWLTTAPGPADEPFSVASVTVPASARSVTIRSVSRDIDSRFVSVPIPNDTPFTVTVIPTGSGPAPVAGISAEFAFTTPSIATPPTPEEPTRASWDATANLDGNRLTAYLPITKPGDWVYGFAYSTPSALGWAQVGADQTAVFDLSGLTLAPGTHRLAVVNNAGIDVGMTSFVIPGAPGAPSADPAAASEPTRLAETGTEADLPLGAAVTLLIAGASLIAVRRRTTLSARTKA